MRSFYVFQKCYSFEDPAKAAEEEARAAAAEQARKAAEERQAAEAARKAAEAPAPSAKPAAQAAAAADFIVVSADDDTVLELSFSLAATVAELKREICARVHREMPAGVEFQVFRGNHLSNTLSTAGFLQTQRIIRADYGDP